MLITISSVSYADNLIDKISSIIGIESSEDANVLVDGISLSGFEKSVHDGLDDQVFETSLRYSKNVEISMRSVNNGVVLHNEGNLLILELTFFVDVNSTDVDYSEKLMYETTVKPYFDYSVDSLAFYPSSQSKLYSLNSNTMTGTELESRVYPLVSKIVESAIKNAYIKGLTADQLANVEKYIESLKLVYDTNTNMISIVVE